MRLKRRYFNALGVSCLFAGLNPIAFASPSPTILAVGDSLSAEYGIARGTGWVALLEQKLSVDKPQWRVINASISGDTTSGGKSRIQSLLKQHQPSIVIIELGGNDALRGLSLESTQKNLTHMIETSTTARAKVLLLGMQVPPNYGPDYSKAFAKLFTDLAKKHRVACVPFLLSGIADASDPTALFQSDRIHPLAAAHPRILSNVWTGLQKLL